MLSSFLLLALLQTPTVPTGPVVRMTGPVPGAVDMFADGSTILYRQPATTVPRVPPQDSNDVAQKFALVGCELWDLGKVNTLVKSVLDKHKVSCP